MTKRNIPTFLIAAPLPRHRRTIPRRTITSSTAPPSVVEIAHQVRTRQTSVKQIVESTLTRISQLDPHINAFLTVDVATAQARAAHLDALIARGENPGILAGVPVAVKDNLCTKSTRTTAASAILDNFVPPYNATAVERLEAEGAVIIGKTNMDEFGMGSSSENSAFVATRNPWDTSRVPGGSSGGSAAAVAAGMVPVALGSDTGGSVRLPAGFCGIGGVKPSYGRVSRNGLLAYASSLDCVGVLGRYVGDLEVVLDVIGGECGSDSTSVEGRGRGEVKVVGVLKEAMEGGDGDVVRCVQEGVKTLEGLGMEVKEVSIEGLRGFLAAYYVLACSEASANLARYDGVRYGERVEGGNLREMYGESRKQLGEEVKRRVMMGTFALSSGYYDAYYLKAQKARAKLSESLRRIFEDVDVLVTPVCPGTAFRLGEKVNDPVAMFLDDVMTVPASLAGLPALSVPTGFVKGLPVGMQIVGRYLDEEAVLKVGRMFQEVTDFHLQMPKVQQLVAN